MSPSGGGGGTVTKMRTRGWGLLLAVSACGDPVRGADAPGGTLDGDGGDVTVADAGVASTGDEGGVMPTGPGRNDRVDPGGHDDDPSTDDGTSTTGEPADSPPHHPPTPDAYPAYEEVTAAAGIDTPHQAKLAHFAIGQAWGDFDGDGLQDLYLTGGLAASHLYRNNGDGTFSLVPSPETELVGAATAGAVWVDYDADGFDDLFVTTDNLNRLFRNLSGVSFMDVTLQEGLLDSSHSVMATWADYDEDGRVDLYVANHALDTDRLWRNTPTGFQLVTDTLPGSDFNKPAFAATFTDVDHDGDLDLYVVNDHIRGNDMFINLGGGQWDTVAERNGSGILINGMGLAIGDYDNDLDVDFFMSGIYHSHLLRSGQSQRSPMYKYVSPAAGVDFDAISWGTVFVDFDNDGWRDLYMCTQHPDAARANRLWRNNGDATFEDVSDIGGAMNLGWSYGVGYADYDEDGGLDLVVGNRGEDYHLYRNTKTVGADHHWLTLDLEGAGPIHRNAIGTKVIVTDTAGRRQMAEIYAGSTMGGGNSRRLHFGLGMAQVERIQIYWLNGVVEEIHEATDTVLHHTYGG